MYILPFSDDVSEVHGFRFGILLLGPSVRKRRLKQPHPSGVWYTRLYGPIS